MDAPDPPRTLTDEQRAAMEAWLSAHPYGEQDENGIDLSLLRKNLRLTRPNVTETINAPCDSPRRYAVPESAPDFVEILRRLNESNVRYVLIGGLAMMLHGSANITQDIDIGYARTPENYSALASALRGMNARLRNFPPDLPFLLDADLTLETDFAPFDVLGHIAGAEDFEALYARSVPTGLEGVQVRIASLNDLISMKRAANRFKDRNHVLELEALKRLLNEATG